MRSKAAVRPRSVGSRWRQGNLEKSCPFGGIAHKISRYRCGRTEGSCISHSRDLSRNQSYTARFMPPWCWTGPKPALICRPASHGGSCSCICLRHQADPLLRSERLCYWSSLVFDATRERGAIDYSGLQKSTVFKMTIASGSFTNIRNACPMARSPPARSYSM